MNHLIDSEVYLRGFENDDEDFLVQLRRNANLFRYTCGNTYFLTSDHSKKLLHDNLNTNQKSLYLMIVLSDNDTPIGYLSLNDIDHTNKKAQWSGIVIDPQFSGKGYASMAAKLMVKYVFDELNINRVYGYWLEENIASLKMSEKVGFKKEGLLREHVFKEGKYHNVFICSMLKTEYYAKIQIDIDTICV